MSMSEYYRDYVWKNGLPYGILKCTPKDTLEAVTSVLKSVVTYKIASDPYHKRVSIEKYLEGKFSSVIYDSAMFDFRHLKQGEQLAWQKTPIHETETTAVCHIRNQDDRLILIEEYLFDKGLCRECRAFSSIGTLLSVQKIKYKVFNDPFNGVFLFDSNDRPVMSKHYEFDEETREFSVLINENWALPLPLPLPLPMPLPKK